MSQIVKIKKKDPRAVIPQYKTLCASGADGTAVSLVVRSNGVFEYDLGVAVEFPEGYEIQVRPRSSVRDQGLMMCNTPGTIDADYRGSIKVSFYAVTQDAKPYQPGDRVCQLVLKKVERMEFVEVDELSDTERGEGGHGSTGLKNE